MKVVQNRHFFDGVLRTLPWRTYSWGDEDVNFHPLIFRYQIANSTLILFKAFCILQCAREFPQASEFENFLICLVLLITRNFHFYFAFKYSLLLFWGIIMAARSMFSCCRHEATSLVGMYSEQSQISVSRGPTTFLRPFSWSTQKYLQYRFLEVLLRF